jgi:hypothetical protein
MKNGKKAPIEMFCLQNDQSSFLLSLCDVENSVTLHSKYLVQPNSCKISRFPNCKMCF